MDGWMIKSLITVKYSVTSDERKWDKYSHTLKI